MKLSRFLIVFYFVFIVDSYAKLRILTWDQQNVFNEAGQEVTITTKMRAEDLLFERQYYKSWSYIFDKDSRVNILEAKVLEPIKYRSTFGDNKLTIEFDKLFNNKEITLYIRYQLLNDDKVKYIRREWAYLPDFTSGANGSLIVIPLKNMDVYSTNDIFSVDYYGRYTWSGTIPADGINELFEMTMKQADWIVSSVVNIHNNSGALGNLEVTISKNFVGGNNEIIDYKVSTSQGSNDKIIKIDDEKIKIKFINYQNSDGFVRIDARIRNNYNNFYWLNDFDINDTLAINNDYLSEYNTLIYKIKQEDTSNNPVHVKIAKWVYENMNYDESFVGRNMTSKEVLELKTGVCEHYALLYQDLLRSIGIPAKTVTGISYDFDKSKFENHAWVMVNYNSQWLPIDPTWGIYSGKLPISHIFMYNDKTATSWRAPADVINGITVDVENNAIFIKKDKL